MFFWYILFFRLLDGTDSYFVTLARRLVGSLLAPTVGDVLEWVVSSKLLFDVDVFFAGKKPSI
jgi:hypothetical protein